MPLFKAKLPMEPTAPKLLMPRPRSQLPELSARTLPSAAWHACQEMVPKKPTRTPNNKNSALIRKTPRRTSFTLKPSKKLSNNALTKLLELLPLKRTAVLQTNALRLEQQKLNALSKPDNAKTVRVLPMLKILRHAWLTAKTRMVRPLLHAHSLRPSKLLLRLKRTLNAHASLVPKDSPPELLSSPPLTSWPETSLENSLTMLILQSYTT